MLERLRGQEDALGRAADPGHRGQRYKVGNFDVAGNTVVKTEFLKPLFKLKAGEYYSEKKIRKGLEKAREVYGSRRLLGVHRLPGSTSPRDDPNPNQPEAPDALKAPEPDRTTAPRTARRSST